MFDQTVGHTKATLYDVFYASKAKKTYTNLGVSLILVIVFLVFALVPTITTIGTVQEKIEAYKKLNSALTNKINSSKKLSTQLNSTSSESSDGLKEEIDFLNKVYMSDYGLKSTYVNIYQRAQLSNVKILSITPKYPSSELGGAIIDSYITAPSTKGYELDISLAAQDIASVSKFIKSLEGYDQMPLVSRVKSFSVNDLEASFKLSPLINNQSSNVKKSVTFSVVLIVYGDETRLSN